MTRTASTTASKAGRWVTRRNKFWSDHTVLSCVRCTQHEAPGVSARSHRAVDTTARPLSFFVRPMYLGPKLLNSFLTIKQFPILRPNKLSPKCRAAVKLSDWSAFFLYADGDSPRNVSAAHIMMTAQARYPTDSCTSSVAQQLRGEKRSSWD